MARHKRVLNVNEQVVCMADAISFFVFALQERRNDLCRLGQLVSISNQRIVAVKPDDRYMWRVRLCIVSARW